MPYDHSPSTEAHTFAEIGGAETSVQISLYYYTEKGIWLSIGVKRLLDGFREKTPCARKKYPYISAFFLKRSRDFVKNRRARIITKQIDCKLYNSNKPLARLLYITYIRRVQTSYYYIIITHVQNSSFFTRARIGGAPSPLPTQASNERQSDGGPYPLPPQVRDEP